MSKDESERSPTSQNSLCLCSVCTNVGSLVEAYRLAKCGAFLAAPTTILPRGRKRRASAAMALVSIGEESPDRIAGDEVQATDGANASGEEEEGNGTSGGPDSRISG